MRIFLDSTINISGCVYEAAGIVGPLGGFQKSKLIRMRQSHEQYKSLYLQACEYHWFLKYFVVPIVVTFKYQVL